MSQHGNHHSTPCFAYVRVSTAKQREHSVSLEAQREAIERYAHHSGLAITEWFSESKTAAKRGRTEFNRMLRLLKKGKAGGVIIHKIDRGARNLNDWADIVGLADRGITVHVAAESLDLSSRGGRLSADIQAVVAADYIRNLRQEALKGIRGRYRQGLYPRQAPAGYQNNGGGKPKTIDPVMGPLVREAFERYATGRYSLKTLLPLMTRRGLRNTRGRPLCLNSLSLILRNPFYAGLISVRRTGEVYEGKHDPLVKRSLFDAVQAILDGKAGLKTQRHEFTFSRLLRCALCSRTLIAELQKGHVYYRCHTPACPLKCLREERVDDAVRAALEPASLTEEEAEGCLKALAILVSERGSVALDRQRSLELGIAKVNEQLGRLGDLLLDGVFSEEDYHVKKRDLLERRQKLSEELEGLVGDPEALERRVGRYLERATRASLSYEKAIPCRKREMVELFTSNRAASPENVVVELREPFRTLAGRPPVLLGAPDRDVPRTDKLVETLVAYVEEKMKQEKGVG